MNSDLVHSWVEGGLWMMRLVEDGEYVTGIEDIGNGNYTVSLERTKDKIDSRKINLNFLGKDNP